MKANEKRKKKEKKNNERIKRLLSKKYKKELRPRASLKRTIIEPIKTKKITLEDLEKDIREARTLLFIILALTISLFGLMLGIVIKIFF